MWQDIVLAAGNWAFIVALVPTLLHATDKPPISSALMTGGILIAFSCTYWTLGLSASTYSTLALASAWFLIAYQKWRLMKETASR